MKTIVFTLFTTLMILLNSACCMAYTPHSNQWELVGTYDENIVYYDKTSLQYYEDNSTCYVWVMNIGQFRTISLWVYKKDMTCSHLCYFVYSDYSGETIFDPLLGPRFIEKKPEYVSTSKNKIHQTIYNAVFP